jgi:hypothetical protein
MAMEVRIPVSVGELLDKVTILRIKERRISDAAKLANIKAELGALLGSCREAGIDASSDLVARLEAVNEELWEIEDKIRDKEREKRFDAAFIELARAVYITNDRRFELKSQINQAAGSAYREEKSYQAY